MNPNGKHPANTGLIRMTDVRTAGPAAARTPAPNGGFTVVRGTPTDEELGAVVVVLAAAMAAPPPPRENDDRPRAGGWASHWRLLRQPFVPGRDAWRGSLR